VKPVSVIAIGHFDDRRAALCVPRVAEQCHDRFIVDRIDSLGGVEQPVSIVDYSSRDHVWSLDDVERLTGNRTVLSVNVVDGTDELPQLEPSLRDNGTWSGEKAIWVIRTLVDGRVATDLVIDGSERVYEMQPDGTATLVR
jgi:hypothetical protein